MKGVKLTISIESWADLVFLSPNTNSCNTDRETILNPLLAVRFLSKEIFQKPLEISGRIIRSSLDKRIQKFCVTNLEDILTLKTEVIF